MKIAIVCPIGDLSRAGYQRVSQPCLESWRAIGDLFLIHSSRVPLPFEIEAIHIKDDRTFHRLVDGQEYFDHRVVAQDTNIGLNAARQAGYDIAIVICVNWYIEVETGRAIVEKCQSVIKDYKDYDVLYRRTQIKDRLFDADAVVPSILHIGNFSTYNVKVLLDLIEINGIRIVGGTRGDFPEKNGEAFIDTGLEMTDDDFKQKQADIRNYEDLLPKRHGASFEFWLDYFQHRKVKMRQSADAPGLVGQQIMALHQAGSFGDRLL